MDFQLSQEQKQIRETARKIAEDKFAEDALTWEGETPKKNHEVLADHDLLGVTMPEEYGGAGGTALDALMAMEGVGSVCPQTAIGIHSASFGPIRAIAEFGTEEQMEEYIPPIARGDASMSICISEPNAGSDTSNLSTTAEKDGEHYVLNGEKIWISNADTADAFYAYVRFPDGNIGSMIVDADTPGWNVQEPDINMVSGPQSQIFIDDARVHESKVVLKGREALKKQWGHYNIERFGGLAKSLVACQYVFDDALEFVQEREQFGEPIKEFQGVSHMLADMAVKLDISRTLIYRGLASEELPGRLESCMAKVFLSEAFNEIADDALQIKGARGYVGETPESWLYRYVRADKIAGGTTQVHRNNVVKALFSQETLPWQ